MVEYEPLCGTMIIFIQSEESRMENTPLETTTLETTTLTAAPSAPDPGMGTNLMTFGLVSAAIGVLVLLSAIRVLSLSKKQASSAPVQAQPSAPVATTAPVQAPVYVPTYKTAEVEPGDELSTVAAITATILASDNTKKQVIVRSVKKIVA